MLWLHPMCGRYTQTATAEVIAQQFDVAESPLFKSRYNIAPSQVTSPERSRLWKLCKTCCSAYLESHRPES